MASGQWAVNQLGALIFGGNLESNLWDGGAIWELALDFLIDTRG